MESIATQYGDDRYAGMVLNGTCLDTLSNTRRAGWEGKPFNVPEVLCAAQLAQQPGIRVQGRKRLIEFMAHRIGQPHNLGCRNVKMEQALPHHLQTTLKFWLHDLMYPKCMEDFDLRTARSAGDNV